MEVMIKFIFGVTVVAFAMNFMALIGYITTKIRDVVYKKYRINILEVLYFPGDGHGYSEYIFTGLFMVGLIMFLIGSVHIIYKLGNYMYFLF